MEIKRDFIFLGNLDRNDPLVRFNFDTLSSQLRAHEIKTSFTKPDQFLLNELDQNRHTIINFFYKDQDAIKLIKQLVLSDRRKHLHIVCFCSDVEEYSSYYEAYRLADIFICPSLMHQHVLKYVYDIPIHVLREAIDPALAGRQKTKSISNPPNVAWFGFAESYKRSMVILEGVIMEAVKKKWINSFTVISSESLRSALPADFLFVNYDTNKLSNILSSYDYAIFSHVPLDLHINSYIKSPNKAISAIFSGLIPICSDTPNYRAYMSNAGLQEHIFSSPGELLRILSSLSEEIESALFINRLNHAYKYTVNCYSAESQCLEYLNIISNYRDNKEYFSNKRQKINFYVNPKTEIKFRFYWRQQLSKLRNYFFKK